MAEALSSKLKVIGRYTILRELRRDRHSVSYAAVDPVMNRELVVKAVQLMPAGPPVPADERRRIEQAFVRQAQAAGRLHHPHIVTVFDAGLSHEFGFLVIERVAGRPLHELLASGLRPAFVHCASIAARIADALEYAHLQGVGHGHLGPQHVFLLADGSPKVAGFGGWVDDGGSGDEALARTHRLLPYFDNEITDQTRRLDVRSVAVLLYMMLTGRAPPEAPARGTEPADWPPSVQRVRPDTPAALARLVDDALDPRSVTLPRTAGALRDSLTSFIWNERTENVAPSTLGIPLSAPPGPKIEVPAPTRTPSAAPVPGAAPAAAVSAWLHRVVDPVGPWARRYRLPLSAGGALLALGLILGVILGNLRHPETRSQGAGTAAAAQTAAAAPAPGTRPAAAAERPPGAVELEVQPWGEVFVDGKPTGVSPPLMHLPLPAGHHQIEFRYVGAAQGAKAGTWSTDVDVRAHESVTVSHRFEP
ncbi:MAG TPA: protein kinase [Burkholderiaceae bacterium]